MPFLIQGLALAASLSSVLFNAATVYAQAPPTTPAFVGCNEDGFTAYAQSNLDTTTTQATQEQACITFCTNAAANQPLEPHTYSVYRSPTCYCIKGDNFGAFPLAGGIDPATSAADPYTCTSGSFPVTRVRTTFQFNGCYDTVTGTATASGTDPQLDNIYANLCGNSLAVVFQPTYSSGFNYQCGSAFAGTSVTCTKTTFYSYSRNPSVLLGPSIYAKRAIKQRSAAKRQSQQAFESLVCPPNMKACLLSGTADAQGDAYECVDTENDVESCGGCLYGDYGKIAGSNSTIGVNCLDAIVSGSVMCEHGLCSTVV